MRQPLPKFASLFSCEQRERIYEAPMFSGRRHPVWVPLFGECQSLHAGHYRLEQSTRNIEEVSCGKKWLESKKPMLLDQEDVSNASAAMAEIRTFGELLEAGFDVYPVPEEKEESTPDFIGTVGSQQVAFEVAAKLQDREMDELECKIYDAMRGNGPVPKGVSHDVRRSDRNLVTSFESTSQPFGSPNPKKNHDSVQTNAISRVCGIKGDERQLPDDMASVLVVDFNDFGNPLTPHTLIEQAEPVIAGRDGFTSGALWYAFHGWKGAPVFQDNWCFRMQHDGRFRLTGKQKSKLSAVLLMMPKHIVCFENGAAVCPLIEDTRLSITRFPWFKLNHSLLEWEPGDVERQVELHRHMIGRLEARYEDIKWSRFT